jgi:hypothetical protein
MFRLLSLAAACLFTGTAGAQEWFIPRQRPVYVQPTYVPLSGKQLERLIEHTLRHHMGYWVKDVDVDVDAKDGEVEVDIEIRKGISERAAYHQAHHILHCLPELRGFRVEIEIDD